MMSSSSELTPWQHEAGVWLKRDDTYTVAGVSGGKARTCWQLAMALPAPEGLVTAGSRSSPQVNIVAHVGVELGVPVRCFVPGGKWSPELEAAAMAGATLVPVRPGHNSVITARAREWAEQHHLWREIPFGMECKEAVRATAGQVANLPPEVKRLVVPVGSGMSLAGVLYGLLEHDRRPPVLGVCVGADPDRRLRRWAPPLWRMMVDLVLADVDYHRPAPVTQWGAVTLDSVYEAKCIPYLEPGDGLWCVGIRQTEEVAA